MGRIRGPRGQQMAFRSPTLGPLSYPRRTRRVSFRVCSLDPRQQLLRRDDYGPKCRVA